jgi:hypothetical protein
MSSAVLPAPAAAPIELGMSPVYVEESEELVDGEEEVDVVLPSFEVLVLVDFELLDEEV